MRNFYKVLGIASTADDTQIKSAFRQLAKTLHPDLNPGDHQAEQRFKELNQAYEVLRDARARSAYDVFLADGRTEVRRRFTHSAAVMVATFMLTMGSAYVVMALHGARVPLWEGGQLARAPAQVIEATKSVLAGRADSGSGVVAGVAATTLARAMPPPSPLETPTPGTGISQDRKADDGSRLDVVATAAAPAAVPGHGPPASNAQPTAETLAALLLGDVAHVPSPEQGAEASEAVSKLQGTNPGPQFRAVIAHLDGNALMDHAATTNLDARPTTVETAGIVGIVDTAPPVQRHNGKLPNPRLESEILPPEKARKKLVAATELGRRNAAGGERTETALRAAGPVSQGGQRWPTADEPFVGVGTTSR